MGSLEFRVGSRVFGAQGVSVGLGGNPAPPPVPLVLEVTVQGGTWHYLSTRTTSGLSSNYLKIVYSGNPKKVTKGLRFKLIPKDP